MSHKHTPTLLFDYSLVINHIVHYKQLLQKGPEPPMLSLRSVPRRPSHPLPCSKQPAFYSYAPPWPGKQLWSELQTGILGNIKSLVHDIIFSLSSLGLPASHLETPQHLSPCCQLSCTSPPLCSSSVSVTCQSQCLEKQSLRISFKVLLFCTGAGMG